MLIGQSFIYLELLKTASSHTRKVIEHIPDLKLETLGKHTTLNNLASPKDWKNKKIIGNIRNPWDWYVSHWAFACMQRGGMYKRLSNHTLGHFYRSPLLVLSQLSRFRKNQSVVNNCFQDSESKEQFKRWLQFVLFEPTRDVEHTYYELFEYNKLGLYSYEYIQMYAHPHKTEELLTQSLSLQDVKSQLIYDYLIRVESLEQDIVGCAPYIGVKDDQVSKALTTLGKKTNSSIRKPYQEYYDDESKRWIEQQDELIILLHDYQF